MPFAFSPVFAQAIGEYGSAGSIGENFRRLAYPVTEWLAGVSPTAWIVVAVVVVAMVVMRRR